MLHKAERLDRKNLSLLLKKPQGKVFSKIGVFIFRSKNVEAFRFAPIIPRKLKVGSVKMHYLRRVAYSLIRSIKKTHLLPQAHLALIISKEFLDMSFAKKEEHLIKALDQLAKELEKSQESDKV